MCVHPGLKDLVDTSNPRSCTDVNTDGVLKLQHYQDTYISLYKFGGKKAITVTHID